MKIMATLPTYNESENIKPLIEDLLALREEMEVVVIDDNSPDGTWKIVKEMSRQNPRIHLIHRTHERGRGSAGVAGFKFAHENAADYIVEMDADYSHHPRFIPNMLAAAENADIVIGSRLVKGGGEQGRNFLRFLITYLGNLYARSVLWLPIRDCTTGYRLFRREVFDQIDLDQMKSNGPAIVQEILMAAKAKKLRFVEIPILFEERRAGESTFSIKILLRGILSVWAFRLRKWK